LEVSPTSLQSIKFLFTVDIGDSDKVTIWGESAGASSVGFQLTAYGGKDEKLFRGAVMQV